MKKIGKRNELLGFFGFLSISIQGMKCNFLGSYEQAVFYLSVKMHTIEQFPDRSCTTFRI